MKKRRLLFFLMLFQVSVFATDTLTIPSRYPSFVTVYDIDQGLPISCMINAVLDQKGRLWISMCPGSDIYQDLDFYQYNGSKYYPISIEKQTEDSPPITWFLWGITEKGLLYGINQEYSKVFFFNPDTHESQIFSFSKAESIRNIKCGNDNTLYVLSRKEEEFYIYSLQPDKKTFLAKTTAEDIKFNVYTSIIPTTIHENDLWFLNGKEGLIYFDIVSKSFKNYNWKDILKAQYSGPFVEETDQEFIEIHTDRQGNLIIYINQEKCFFRFNKQTAQLTRLPRLNQFLEDLPNENIFKINFINDKKGNLLIQIDHRVNYGLSETTIKTKLLLMDENHEILDYSPISKKIYQLARYEKTKINRIFSTDLEKFLLFGSSGGLMIADIQEDLPIASSLNSWASRGIFPISDNKYMVVHDNGTLSQIDLETLQDTLVPTFNFCNEAFSIPSLAQIVYQDSGSIWFPTLDKRLVAYNLKEQSCMAFHIGFEFNKFHPLNDHEVAIINSNNELFISNTNTGKTTPFRQENKSLNLGGIVNELHVDKDGILWIASLNGLWKIDVERKLCKQLGKPNGFTDDQFMCIHENDEGLLVLGTSAGGLQFFDPLKERVLRVVDQTGGLSNNTVVGILPDKDGDLWVSTFEGLTVLSKEGDILFELYEKDGLSHKEFNRFSYFKTKGGKLIFGAIEGINILEPEKIKQIYLKKRALKIYLSEINYYKNNEQVRLTNKLEHLERIILQPSHRHLNLSFALSDYINPEKNSFSYYIEKEGSKMLDEDKIWMNIGYNSELTLVDLPVGDFTIYIKGLNHMGQWTSTPLSIPVRVKPFFFQTWWFYLICSLPILVGGFFWSQRLVAQNIKLEKEVQYRTRQIVKDKEIIERQAAKLKKTDELKTRFFTNISHEFRTPLTIISGITRQIKDHPESWLEKGVDLIQRNSNQLLSLINQILDLRKLESGHLKVNYIQGNVIEYLKYISDAFVPIAQPKGIQIHFLSSIPNLQMDYDPEKMMHIFSNLLSNAIKYMRGKGNIYLQINQVNKDGDQWLNIQVKDTGKGISPEALPYVFDRFYQVENLAEQKPQGTGIGLALTQELVQLLKGNIKVQSPPNEGTTFLLQFPIVQKAPIQAFRYEKIIRKNEITVPTKPTVALAASGNGNIEKREDTYVVIESNLPTLLLVEDNAELRFYLRSFLEKNYNILEAENGQAGIDMAIEHIPDLIVSDVMMPIKDGFILCDHLKNDARTDHIPIVLLTAKSDFDSKMSGFRKGADAYLTKPFEQEELLTRLEQLLIQRKKLQEKYQQDFQRTNFSNQEVQKSENPFVQKFRQVVLDYDGDVNFGVVYLCRKMGISRTQLHNKMKALTGMTPMVFVRHIRLEKARTLLQTTDLNVSEVCYKVGISNLTYFSRIYSEAFGENPSRTRKQL